MTDEEALRNGEAALARGDFAGAENALSAIWPNPMGGTSDALHLYGIIRWKQQRLQEAEVLLVQAAKADSLSLRHHIALGHVRMEMGKFAHAQEAYGTALHLDPDWPGLQHVYSVTLYAAGRYPEAEASSRAALTIDPTASVWSLLSSSLIRQGKSGDAVAAAREALKREPDSLHAQHSYAAALLAEGKNSEALDAFEKLDAKGFHAPALAVNRGAALERLGRGNEASAVYAEASRRWPNFEAYRVALTRPH